MLGLSQMGGFFTLLIASVLFFALSSAFGGDDSGVDHDHGVMHGESGPSLLSLRNLLLFGVGFGAAGSIATHLGASLVLASVAGVIAGVAIALIGFGFYRAIGRQQASTNTNTTNLVGKKASVSTAILKGRTGQVVASDEHGSTIYLDAHSSDQEPIQQGDIVLITDAAGNFVTVTKQFH